MRYAGLILATGLLALSCAATTTTSVGQEHPAAGSGADEATTAPARLSRSERLIPGQGITALLRVEGDEIEILRLAATSRPAESALQRPTLAAQWNSLPGRKEIVATVHDKSGRTLGSYGFRLRWHGFHDRLVPGGKGRLTGGPVRSEIQVRQVTVPFHRNAAFVVFSRAESLSARRSVTAPGTFLTPRGFPGTVLTGTGPEGVVRFRGNVGAVYPLLAGLGQIKIDLGRELLIKKPIEIDFKQLKAALSPTGKLTVGWSDWTSELSDTEDGASPDTSTPDPSGLVIGWNNLSQCEPSAQTFDIVILGDGFKSSEMSHFRTTAFTLKNGLLGLKPFIDYSDKICVYRIDTPSTDTGVDHCPAHCELPNYCPEADYGPDPKDTVYEVEGFKDNENVCTNFKTEQLQSVFDVTAVVIDPALVDLFIILVNCNRYGGNAHPSERVVFIPAMTSSTPGFAYYPGLVAHESAHVLAELGEEYISCAIPGPNPAPYRNIASKAEVTGMSVWWYELSDKQILPFYNQAETYPNGPCHQIRSAPAPNEEPGLFWGAQYIVNEPYQGTGNWPCQTPSMTPSFDRMCDVLDCDIRGRTYFRPSAYCTMRFVNETFCPVCMHELKQTLDAATTPETPAPPPDVNNLERTDERQ